MENKYTAVIKKEDDWWIGWLEEIPGDNWQEKTQEELLETLRLTLKEALEMNSWSPCCCWIKLFWSRPGTMKRRDLINHLKSYGCEFLREGSRHSWWWNPEQNRRSSVPRHNEIYELSAPTSRFPKLSSRPSIASYKEAGKITTRLIKKV